MNHFIYSCNKKNVLYTQNPLYIPKTPLNKPNFRTHLLKIGWKSVELTLCLAFDGCTLNFAEDLVLNSTVPSQILYLCRSGSARQLELCRIYFQNGEETCRRSLV